MCPIKNKKVYKVRTVTSVPTKKKAKRKQLKKAIYFDNPEGMDRIKVRFKFNGADLAAIKDIRGRIWHKDSKFWTVPLLVENCVRLKELNYTFNKKLTKWAKSEWERVNYVETKKECPKLKIKGLQGELFPYQNDGVSQLEAWNGRGLVADEMGLGKTVQALAWAQLHPDTRPVIVVCPASLKLNWAKEARKWMSKDTTVKVVSGTKSYESIKADVIIINYDILGYWDFAIKALSPKIVILDEAHYIKNSKAQRTKTVMKLCKGVPHILALTGTPVESRPVEIINIINLIDKTIFENTWTFKQRYCGAKHTGWGWEFKGATEVKELHEILTSRVMIRRKKKDVLKELPDKMYSFVPFEIENRKEYNEAEQDFKEYIKSTTEKEIIEKANDLMDEYGNVLDYNTIEQVKEEKAEKANHLTRIEALKQLAAKGKLKEAIKWIENFLESGEKLVIFCEHKFIIEELMKAFSKVSVKIDGTTSIKKRDEAVTAFQGNDKVKLFIGNKAAETGLTLTAASNVLILEYPWTPGALNQRIDRCHRIGQVFTVNVWYGIAINTIDEVIARLMDSKQRVVSSILDGKSSVEFDLVNELFKTYR